jgi:hypothetical protein
MTRQKTAAIIPVIPANLSLLIADGIVRGDTTSCAYAQFFSRFYDNSEAEVTRERKRARQLRS